jgi:hypothetical protein
LKFFSQLQVQVVNPTQFYDHNAWRKFSRQAGLPDSVE